MSSIGAAAGPFDGASRHRHFLARRFERDAHRRLGLQLIDVGLIHRCRALLREERLDRRTHLIERRALHARRVGVVPRRDISIGHGRDLRPDFLVHQRAPS